MAYYVLPYKVLFHDTMAYGSHHHMTNFKFQNYARETMLFGSDTPGNLPWQEQLKDIVMLTREAYSLNLAPVNLGEKVGIVMSYEEPTRSTVRLCFRTIKEDGTPVNCGFQTMVLVHKDTGNLVPGPQIMTQFLDKSKPYCILEEDSLLSFKEKVLKGGAELKAIFSERLVSLAKFVANSPIEHSHPKIMDTMLREYSLTGSISTERKKELVFTFPGQGAYNYETLKEIYHSFPDSRDLFHQADAICQRLLGRAFLPLIHASTKGAHDKLLAFYPDLNQIGIYLSEVTMAQQYLKKNLRPDLLLGHSFGEIAALAIAGVYSLKTGIEIVCNRVLALHQVRARGCMAAVYCDKQKTVAVLEQLSNHTLEITVSNHPKQTVISGISEDIDRLAILLAREGISLTKLNSAYPFHSSFLTEAVAPFKKSLKAFTYSPASIPVYHCTENKMYEHGEDVAAILSQQFVKTLDFRSILSTLRAQGYERYVECGAGDTLTKIVLKNFTHTNRVLALSTEVYGKSLNQVINENIQACRSSSLPDHVTSSKPEHAPKVPTQPIPSKHQVHEAVSLPLPLVKPMPEQHPEMPIAIVSTGCFLPAAANPQEFWANIKKGVDGVKNLGEIDPKSRLDFVAGSLEGGQHIVPDKTYALITGNISLEDIGYDEALLKDYYTAEAFSTLSRGQRLLAVSLIQTKNGFQFQTEKSIPVIIGSTADGSSEYDDAIFLEHLLDTLDHLQWEEGEQKHFGKLLEEITGHSYGQSEDLRQVKLYREVVEHIFGQQTSTYVVDSACSSSLYSINLGIMSLLNQESDVVLAGGVFAPGPANNTLFAQFRGLTPHQSRPLDHKADGVVFSDGGCIVALKRLSDAMAQGDKVLGVIRGVGLSSDGKSPSINVPQSKGQRLAVSRAYEKAQIDPNTIQYIEAHATSTPVGDSVEFNSLKSFFKSRPSGLDKIELGSVKSLIGHTGWVSGAASLLKICFAFEQELIPKQYHYEAPNTQIKMDDAPFRVSTEERPWKANSHHLPRRAGINSFGFGGTNAHLVLEAYDKTYHTELLMKVKPLPTSEKDLVLVNVATLFPGVDALEQLHLGDKQYFDRSKVRLPKKKMLLPDVVEHMDISQFLAPLAVERFLETLPEVWTEYKEDIGVVLGITTKTDRGAEANERVFLDRLNRIFTEKEWNTDLPTEKAKHFMELLIAHIRESKMPSGPYTLPGLMPNVTSSRINSMFDLKGPNFVVDMDDNSLAKSINAGVQLLQHGDCKMTLVGAVNARNSVRKDEHDAAVVMAITTVDFARKLNMKVEAHLSLAKLAKETSARPKEKGQETYFGAAQGILELIEGIGKIKDGEPKVSIVLENTSSEDPIEILLSKESMLRSATNAIQASTPEKEKDSFEFIAKTPVFQAHPVLVPTENHSEVLSLKNKRLLIVTDQPELFEQLPVIDALKTFQYEIVTTGKGNRSGKFLNIRLDGEEVMKKGLAKLEEYHVEAIIFWKDLKNYSRDALLVNDFAKEKFHELMFAVCKHFYSRMQDKSLLVGTLCFNAFIDDQLNPYTGLISGFMKSVIRELPEANIRMVNTSDDLMDKALQRLESEFGQKEQEGEICYLKDKRYEFQLESTESLSKPETPFLNKDSVILVTGGGRGVTAVLAEKLLEVYGCTVVALGRTSLEGVPQKILDMSIEEYKAYESMFYKEELASDKTQKIPELKTKYWKYQAANELAQVIKTCQALNGTYQYLEVDINDKSAISRLMKKLFKNLGKVDMVMHGAGVQVSKLLPTKDYSDFRRIVATKLLSLNHLYKACERNRGEHKVHYHLLTSAFSFMGNDGQPDYGAANEAMNRLADSMNGVDGINWSSMAWLGWAGIGMTRGSEFAALAMRRKLRGITKEEGQFIFMDLMAGAPRSAINVLMAGGEVEFYNVAFKNEPIPIPFPVKESRQQLKITVENTPILLDHKINGIPTLPGAMVIAMAADAAKKLRPKLHVKAFQDTGFLKFNRVFEDKGLDLKIDCKVIEESATSARIRVRFMTDFYHKTGVLLQQNIMLTETFVNMTDQLPKPVLAPLDQVVYGTNYPDPYVLSGNLNVSLAGAFDVMKDIVVGDAKRVAHFALQDVPLPESMLNYLIPSMIMVDAFWRFGTIQPIGERKLAVFVPEKCGEMKVFFDFTNFDQELLRSPLTFVGHNPRIIGDQLEVGPIQILDKKDNVILVVEKGVCRKFEEIDLAVEELPAG